MSRHYGTIIEPDQEPDALEWEQEGYAEMQAELAEIAERDRTEREAEQYINWERT